MPLASVLIAELHSIRCVQDSQQRGSGGVHGPLWGQQAACVLLCPRQEGSSMLREAPVIPAMTPGDDRQASPEHLQQGLAVGHHLVLPDPGVPWDAHGCALDAEVPTQLHIEAHLHGRRAPPSVPAAFEDSCTASSFMLKAAPACHHTLGTSCCFAGSCTAFNFVIPAHAEPQVMEHLQTQHSKIPCLPASLDPKNWLRCRQALLGFRQFRLPALLPACSPIPAPEQCELMSCPDLRYWPGHHPSIPTCTLGTPHHSLLRSPTHLPSFGVLAGLQPHIVDVCVGEVIAAGGQSNVDLAGQVAQRLVALAIVGDHVVNLCSRCTSDCCRAAGQSTHAFARSVFPVPLRQSLKGVTAN